jgi:hypothetical protein
MRLSASLSGQGEGFCDGTAKILLLKNIVKGKELSKISADLSQC